jgi:LasA protease
VDSNLRRLQRAVLQIKQGSIIACALSIVLGLPAQAGGLSIQYVNSLTWQHQVEQSASDEPHPSNVQSDTWEYRTQSGDTLEIIAARFMVRVADVSLERDIPSNSLLDPDQILIIQRPKTVSSLNTRLLPDVEVVYSPNVWNFNTLEYVSSMGGYLSQHQEYLRSTGLTRAADIIDRVAVENSINPRLLLALLEYKCGCLAGDLPDGIDSDFLMQVPALHRRGLYRQLGWVVNQLSLGYYGWRQGLLHDLVLADGSTIALPPDWNAGSAALAYLFSRFTDREGWFQVMDPEQGFVQLYATLFAGERTQSGDNQELFPPGLLQPELILPFELEREWSFTSGPHPAWETEGALAALDFAPASDRYGCDPSTAWVLAAADGLVVRSENNAIALDLDGDGDEGTGWVILYMHLADYQRQRAGRTVQRGDQLGHPSCEGGPADGTHVHIARKYNGEWIAAAGPLPFVMDGWVARAGYKPYDGSLTRGVQVVIANPLSPAASFISRSREDYLRESRISRDLWWEE